MHGSSEPPERIREAAASFPRKAVEAQLTRIFASAEFVNADQLKDLLSYLVRRKLNDPERPVTEYDLAYDVFHRDAGSFNPAEDAIVRRTTKRLRDKLSAYYANGGKRDSIIIELPKGKGYEPCFRRRRSRMLWIWAAAVFALLLCVSLGYYFRARPPRAQASIVQSAMPARIFANSTSEGQRLRIIGGPQRYGQLLMTPDGRKLYAVSDPDGQLVTVFRATGAATDLVAEHVFRLPSPTHSAVMSPDGTRIYAGSNIEGVTVLSTATDRPERTIHTGAPVFGLAVTPDNRKLFVAMGNAGLGRIDLSTGNTRILSAVAYPFGVGLDGSGRNLYVAYQRGGPGGRWGHDVMAVYDTETENVSYIIKDLPMVGIEPLFAPRGEVVLLDFADACWSSFYDHVGCPAVPSGGFHLWDPANRRVIATIALPNTYEAGAFLTEGTRLLLVADEMSVWDWAGRRTLEKMRVPKAGGKVEIVSRSDRIFVPLESGGILALEPEKPQCQPPTLGLVNFYSGDGTLNDSFGTGGLTAQGNVQFVPGRIGQAFAFDGRSALLATKVAADYCPYCKFLWTEAFFVKFHSTIGEMVTMESPAASYRHPGHHILKSNDNHLVLEVGGRSYPGVTLSSRILIQADRWYHVTVVAENNHRSLFVDGTLQAQGDVPVGATEGGRWRAIFGEDQHGRHPLRGLLDEIVVYDRALTPAEVESLATSCPAP